MRNLLNMGQMQRAVLLILLHQKAKLPFDTPKDIETQKTCFR